MGYYDYVYEDKDKKYYKRFKAIKKGKRQPSEKDLIYISHFLGIDVKQARLRKTEIYSINIDDILKIKSN